MSVEKLVAELIRRGIEDARVLAAMRRVPRHEFVPEGIVAHAHDDCALPIGEGQTISQPYIVALMTELAELDRDSRVLEIGTGSGYQTAVLAEIVREVHSIEIVEPLARRAAITLARRGYPNLRLRTGDGHAGWPAAAPFDAILVTAAPPRVPEPLLDQLCVGGRLVLPVGDEEQALVVIERTGRARWAQRRVLPVSFVPMTGRAQEPAPLD